MGNPGTCAFCAPRHANVVASVSPAHLDDCAASHPLPGEGSPRIEARGRRSAGDDSDCETVELVAPKGSAQDGGARRRVVVLTDGVNSSSRSRQSGEDGEPSCRTDYVNGRLVS